MASTVTLINKDRTLASVVVEYSCKGKIKRFSTGVRVPVKYWSKDKKQVLAGGTDNVKADNILIDGLKSKVDAIIREYFNREAKEPTTDYVATEFDRIYNTVEVPAMGFFQGLDEVIRVKSLDKSKQTIKNYTQLKSTLLKFQDETKYKITFDSLNKTFWIKYKEWLLSKNYVDAVISKRVSTLRTVMEFCVEHGMTDNVEFKKFSYKANHQKNFDEITVNESELNQLLKLDLTKNKRLEYVRDLFVLQAWCGLRYSDVVRLSKKHIVKLKGKEFIKINIKKTKDISEVPLFPVAKMILEKYDYRIKSISNDKYNEYIKEVCRMLPALQDEVSQIRYSGQTELEITNLRCDLVSTHTARRSFITMCLEKGVKPTSVMKWSNHSDSKTFVKYINKSQGIEAEIEKMF